jgi:predicted transposase YbfD/YdcC
MFFLAQVPDPRRHNVVHGLAQLLMQILVATAGGANNPFDIGLFCEAHREWFARVCQIHKVPSHDTISRVLAVLDPERLELALRAWTQSKLAMSTALGVDIISVDGKALNGLPDGSYLNLVSALSTRNGLVLGSLDTHESKKNEMNTVVALVKQLSLKGTVVVADAAATFKPVVTAIRAQKADYVLPVKGNQPTLAESVQLCFERPFSAPTMFQTCDAEGGKVVTRTYEFIVLGKRKIPFSEDWQDLRGVGKATTHSVHKKNGKETSETRYFVTSLTDAAVFAHTVRSHWAVESMHWMLDVVFREDACKVRDKVAQTNLNTVRKIVLNAFRAADLKIPLSHQRKLSGWNQGVLWESMQMLFK